MTDITFEVGKHKMTNVSRNNRLSQPDWFFNSGSKKEQKIGWTENKPKSKTINKIMKSRGSRHQMLPKAIYTNVNHCI